MPCGDDPQPEIASPTINIAHQNSQETEFCSPICLCNCCGHQLLVFDTLIQSNVAQVKLNENQNHQNDADFDFNMNAIWQPPKSV